jgi:hypothetical protein
MDKVSIQPLSAEDLDYNKEGKGVVKVYSSAQGTIGNLNDFNSWMESIYFEKSVEDYHAVIIGEPLHDIHPSYYGDEVLRDDSYTPTNSIHQDNAMTGVSCNLGIRRDKPIIAIADAASFVCALAGGKVIQHARGHSKIKKEDNGDYTVDPDFFHDVSFVDDKNKVYKVPSAHYSMMWPFNLSKEDYTILAYSKVSNHYQTTRFGKDWMKDAYKNQRLILPMISEAEYFGDDKGKVYSKDAIIEPEIVWFHKINALAIHPNLSWSAKYDKNPKKREELVDKIESIITDFLGLW